MGRDDEACNGYAHAEPYKGFYDSLGNLQFKTNPAVFTGRDGMARGIYMFMVMFYDNKNARPNDG